MAEFSFEIAKGAVLFIGGISASLLFLFGVAIMWYSDRNEYKYHQTVTGTLLDAIRGTLSGGSEKRAMFKHGLVVHKSNVWMSQSTLSDEAIDSIFDK